MIYKVLIHILHPNLPGFSNLWRSQPIRGSFPNLANNRASIWKSAWSKWLWSHSMIFTQIIKVIIFTSSSVTAEMALWWIWPHDGVREPEQSFEGHFLFDKMFICLEFMRSDSKLRWFVIYFLGGVFSFHFIDELWPISKSPRALSTGVSTNANHHVYLTTSGRLFIQIKTVKEVGARDPKTQFHHREWNYMNYFENLPQFWLSRFY